MEGAKTHAAISGKLRQSLRIADNSLFNLEDNLLHLAASGTTEAIFYTVVMEEELNGRSVRIMRKIEHGSYKVILPLRALFAANVWKNRHKN